MSSCGLEGRTETLYPVQKISIQCTRCPPMQMCQTRHIAHAGLGAEEIAPNLFGPPKKIFIDILQLKKNVDICFAASLILLTFYAFWPFS